VAQAARLDRPRVVSAFLEILALPFLPDSGEEAISGLLQLSVF
jgi:hypothetical protein